MTKRCELHPSSLESQLLMLDFHILITASFTATSKNWANLSELLCRLSFSVSHAENGA